MNTSTEYPYGYCGMPCALCSRYRANGTSRCVGCSHGGYYADPCKVNHCCREKELAHCRECSEFPCERLGRMGDFRDLDTGCVKPRTGEYIAQHGFEEWYEEYAARAALLTEALERYNDGRMKRFLCELFIKHDFAWLQALMNKAEALSCSPKELAKAFRELAGAQAEK